MNPLVEVDSGGQPRSRGRKGRTRAMEEGGARNGGGNPSRDPRALLSPAQCHLPRSPKPFPPSIEVSCIEREVEIEKRRRSRRQRGEE
jgi:hypothetical protein